MLDFTGKSDFIKQTKVDSNLQFYVSIRDGDIKVKVTDCSLNKSRVLFLSCGSLFSCFGCIWALLCF